MSTPIVRRRRRPSEVDTIQWLGDNEADVIAFTGPGVFRAIPADQRTSTPEITASVYDKLHDTWVGVYTGQHIVRGIQGEHYPIAEDVLAETYEPVIEPMPGSARAQLLHQLQCEGAFTEQAATELVEAFRVEALTNAGVEYEDCTTCGAARRLDRPCSNCDFQARMDAELKARGLR